MKKTILILSLLFIAFLGFTQDEALTIDAEGNVGIGITEPQAKLDVNGDVNVTGDIITNGNVIGTNLLKEIIVIEDTYPARYKVKTIQLPERFNEENVIILSVMAKNGSYWHMVPFTWSDLVYLLVFYMPETNEIRLDNAWNNNDWDNKPVRITVGRF